MRVLVTRAAADAEGVAAALSARRHTAVLAPVIEIRPTGATPPPGRFSALVATSRHAFADAGATLDRTLPVFAVGRRTAAAARAAGFRDTRVGAGNAASLADLLRLTLPRPARLLYRAGRHRKPDLEAVLSGAGYDVAVMEAYDAEALEHWPAAAREALRDGQVDAALHYSRRSADLALAVAEREGLAETLLALPHLCLSEDVAAPLRARGAARVTVADRPDEDALLALLDAAR